MADKKVTVKVDLSASGNLSAFSSAAGMSMDRLAMSSDKATKKIEANQKLIAGMSASGAAQKQTSMSALSGLANFSPGGFLPKPPDFSMSGFSATSQGKPGPNQSQVVMGELKTFSTGIEKASLAIGAMTASAAGFVAAASPAAFQTFTGSLQLAAGELGIIFIPAIVKVSRFFQDVASTIQRFDAATGGLVGKMAGAVAVPLTIIALGGAAIGTTKWLYNMMASAFGASKALDAVAASGGGAAIGGASPGGGFLGGAGKIGKGLGIAAIGSGVSQMSGSAIGGTAGGYLSSIGTGASIGAGIGTMIAPGIGTAIGAGIGVLVGGITQAITSSSDKKTAMSMNFTAGSESFENMHDVIQREAIKDPMQQQQADQQARAVEKLAIEIGYLSATLGRNQPWQAGN